MTRRPFRMNRSRRSRSNFVARQHTVAVPVVIAERHVVAAPFRTRDAAVIVYVQAVKPHLRTVAVLIRPIRPIRPILLDFPFLSLLRGLVLGTFSLLASPTGRATQKHRRTDHQHRKKTTHFQSLLIHDTIAQEGCHRHSEAYIVDAHIPRLRRIVENAGVARQKCRVKVTGCGHQETIQRIGEGDARNVADIDRHRRRELGDANSRQLQGLPDPLLREATSSR